MSKMLRNAMVAVVAFAVAPSATPAEPEAAGVNTVPLTTLLAAVAKRSDKKFIVDPRVKGDVVLLQEHLASVSYDDLLMIMQVHGFAAVTNGNYIQIVPDAIVRQMPLPIANDEKHPAAQYVSKILPVKNIPAVTLVPILRPLLPQQAHLVAMTCTNDLIIVDTYGNIQRLEKLIKSLDRGEPFVPNKCSADAPRPADKRSDS